MTVDVILSMKELKYIVGIALSLFFPTLVPGQETGMLRMNKKQWNPESDIALWGGVEDGRFKPVHAAQLQWSAGAEAHFLRPGNKSTWTAAVSLEQTMGKHRGSSLFLEPDLYPMDLLDVTTGWTSRQTGRVEFGFLSDLSDIWAAGLKASVKAANEAKRTDLRHSAFGMEAQLEPTLTFVSDDDACMIASYHVLMRTERAKASAGDTDVFLDKGMRYGGYEPGLSVFPVLELAHGFFGQYRSPWISGGLGITWKRGRAGENGYNRFRFPGRTPRASKSTRFTAYPISGTVTSCGRRRTADTPPARAGSPEPCRCGSRWFPTRAP